MTAQLSSNQSSPPSEEPLYNIGVVSRMTDIPVATLRVWERRYEFPESSRTEGGHRLYSELEVLRLRWVKSRIDEGMQTGRAVKALRHLEGESGVPGAPLSASTRSTTSRTESAPLPAAADSSIGALTERLTDALMTGNTGLADQILGEGLALYPMESLILDVIQPSMAAIGQAWHDNLINIAVEHVATNYLRHRMLMWMVTGPQPRRVPPVILACAPDELHEGGLLMLGVILRRRGWPVTYLGQSMPLPDLASYVQTVKPSAVVLVSMHTETAQKLLEWPRWLSDAYKTGNPPICFGGGVFTRNSALLDAMPGIYLGETLTEGIATLDNLLTQRTRSA